MTPTRQMEFIFAGMAKIKLNQAEKEAQRERDTAILSVAQQYVALLEQVQIWLPDAEDRYIAGIDTTVYQKKLGLRPLTKADVESLVKALGTDQQQQLLIDWAEAQTQLSQRLKKMTNLGLVLEQADVNYNTYYLRAKRPELWQTKEIIAIMTTIERLKL